MTQIYFSNDLKRLAEHLGKELFGAGAKPFSPRTVVVPSDRYKRFLQQFFAEDERFQIAMGVEIVTLPSMLSLLCHEELKKHFPSYILLEQRLFLLAQEVKPLDQLSDHQRKTICHELSHVFHKYGTHGEGFLKEWKKKSGWQQVLWRAVYEDSPWTYPLELFEKTIKLHGCPHLFGFSSMPSAQAQFFKKQDAIFYLFSPCRLFWSDLMGARERAHFHIDNEDPTLLSSWGKWGKRLLNSLAAEEMQTEEEYVEPDPGHTLGALQKSLIDLEPPVFSSSETVRIFSARHRMQEIEELYEEVHRLLQEHDDLLPSDILLLSPDIDGYVPYIHAVFGKKESQVDYAIQGIEQKYESRLAEGIELIFDLIEEKWSLEAIMQVFSHSLFAGKRHWQKTDLEEIRRWLSAAKTTWGFDFTQRKRLLHTEDLRSEAGTVQFSIDRLLFGLTSTATTETPLPLPQIGWAETELFTEMLEALMTLEKHCKSAIAGEKKPLHAWIDWVLQLIEHFAEEETWIKEELTKIRLECADWQEAVFSWREGKKLCMDLFEEKSGGFQKHLLEAIQFDRLDEGTILDKKVIVLFGMQDGAFPRKDIDSSLDELLPKPSSRGEIDRFLFLEALIKAKQILLISYLHSCPERQIELPASLVVQELCAYAEKWGGKLEIRTLPERNFLGDASYFSSSRYRKAKAYTQRKGQEPKLFGDWHEIVPLPSPMLPEEEVIDLSDLALLLKDPIEFYFRNVLEFPIQWTDEKAFEEGEFLLQQHDKQKLLRNALSKPLEEVVAEWEREKGLPFGAFGEIALNTLSKEKKTLEESLTRHQMAAEDARDIVISPWKIDLGGKEVILQGKIKDVSSKGLLEFFNKERKEVLLQRWADLLILKGHPELQAIPAQVFFIYAKKDEKKALGEIDPLQEIRKLLEYYALCKKRLSPFMLQWAMHLLKGEKEKLEDEFRGKYCPRYVGWIIGRDGMPNANVLCATWSEFLQKTFGAYAAI